MVNLEANCGCKGVRYCSLCVDSDRVKSLKLLETFDVQKYSPHVYCLNCKAGHPIEPGCYSLEQLIEFQQNFDHHSNSVPANSVPVNSVLYVPDFLTENEESDLMKKIDLVEWKLSQSGRRKQDYGPKVNFKKQKVKIDGFEGMPFYHAALLNKMAANGLGDYVPFELCNLEYDPARRSTIEPHTDDTWIWGERLISINLGAGSVMTLWDQTDKIVYVPMQRRSLLCMFGHMRYHWKHSVLPEHITERRIALTMREADRKFLPDGELFESIGKDLIARSKNLIDV